MTNAADQTLTTFSLFPKLNHETIFALARKMKENVLWQSTSY
ncbi:hypothetical protein L248_0941 [Schleiferilactobacillus shenzhenensis LY-73]|uniref:Uncharacterized protein n=1 Tax=Schleiferilactobacillus shenzhenensis LY-73 TaxID=1231336 RepID=U4TJL7_9LACO|nr:hypothetical protein L248_0941 [Schleiferilactobacillus shenzhenensis LY-73]